MTQEYIGTKIITAWHADFKSPWPDEPKPDPPRPGYAVKYADGYTSWSPKEAFEAAYLPIGQVAHLPPWRQRLIGELAQINDKVEKLSKFIADTSPAGEHSLLLGLQLEAMIAYRDAVARRIDLINVNMGLNLPSTATGD